jgi:hypothetical protein
MSIGLSGLAIGLNAKDLPAAFTGQASNSRMDFDVNLLSRAVAKGASSEFARAFNRAQVGNLTAGDVQAVVAGASILFSHLEEIGANASTERKIRDKRNNLLDFAPSNEDMDKTYIDLLKIGFQIEQWQVRKIMELTMEGKIAALDLIDNIGIRGIQEKSLGYLRKFSMQLMETGAADRKKQVHHAAFAQATPDDCRQIQTILIGLEIDIGLNAAACGLGVLPACWIALALQSYATALFIQMLYAGCFG